jgi:transcriptional regulator with XRE-family HTH domain
MAINKLVAVEARKQVGFYLQDVLNQRGWNRAFLAEKSGLSREQIKWILEGDREYTIDTFLSIIQALDCYFFLADKEGEHLNFEHMNKKANPEKGMDFAPGDEQ